MMEFLEKKSVQSCLACLKAEQVGFPLHMDHFINGSWRASRKAQRIEVRDSSNWDQLVGTVGSADEGLLVAAADSAAAAFGTWRRLPARDRSEKMQAVADTLENSAKTLGHVVAHELGRPYPHAVGEVMAAVRQLRYFAEEAIRWRGCIAQSDEVDKEVLLIDRPVGVVLMVSPWNNPLFLLSRTLAPALAAGCTVIGKPSSESPLSTLLMAKIAHEAGLGEGVFNVVTGPGRSICGKLLAHPAVQKGTLTGGREAGRAFMVAAAKHLKVVSLELGGQCPAIVCEDALLETAADSISFQAFRQGGQVCNRVNRVYIHEGIYREFVKMLCAAISKICVGLIGDYGADYGALVNQEQIDKAKTHVEDAVQKGATIETGGTQLTEGAFVRGYYFAPTLLSNCSQDMLVMTEETFGPVLGVTSYSDFDKAVELANDNDYGLASYLFTKNATRCHRAIRSLEAGNIWINDIHVSYAQCPYGGVKASGTGRTQAIEAFREFVATTTVYWDFADYPRKSRKTRH